MKKFICFIVAGLFVSGLFSVSVAQEAKITTPEKKAIDAGNKICPVSGEKIDEKMKAAYEYQGKIYNFCCPACIDDFKKDPEKYIKKVNEEMLKKTDTEESESDAADVHSEGHMHHS